MPNAKVALQHNIGLGGAVVVALYQLGFPQYRNPHVVARNAAAASGPDGFVVTPFLHILEQAMLEDTDGLIEKHRAIYGLKVVHSSLN